MNKKTTFGLPGGPGILITAAFIGPGTVTICTLAGAQHGLQLLWAVILSTFITVLFQEMSSRLSIVTQMDLTSLIRQELKNPAIRILMLGIVLASIVVGNAAYEAGNIAGGVLGLDTFFTLTIGPFSLSPVLVGGLAFLILWFGNHGILEKTFTVLVLIMSLSFLITAILTKPNLVELIRGSTVPSIPDGGLLLVLGVIGTTIVPYNLFLHAALSKKKWNSSEDIPAARKNTIVSILIGGVVSSTILISASSLQGAVLTSAVDLGKGLEPVFGPFAKYLISLGLFAAGTTSAITAPLAAAYVTANIFNIKTDLTSWKFKTTWMIILIIGVVFSSLGFKPVDIIRFAQVSNGLLLPIVGILLVWLSAKSSLLGKHQNRLATTLIASILIILIAALGIKSIWQVL